MSATGELIAALMAGGMNAADAASLVARAAVEMTGALTKKSAGAARQQRYRERNKASLSVTRDAVPEASQTVTKRNEASQSDGAENSPISYLLPVEVKILSKKEESKKERTPKKRNAPLPDGWQPSLRSFQIAEQCGQNVQLVEQIFRDYLKSSGKLYADHDAAFNNFIRNQQRFNGKHGTSQAKSGGSLTESIRRELAELEQSEGADFALPVGRILRISN